MSPQTVLSTVQRASKLHSALLLSFALLLVAAALLLAACQSESLAPPRLATATALAAMPTPAPAVPIILPAPTATADPLRPAVAAPQNVASLSVWINETSPEHRALLEEMMAGYSEQSGVDVALRLVSPSLLPELMRTAVLSDTLPDIVLHPLEYTVTWSEDGILAPAVADAIVDEIGRDTFNQDALRLVTIDGTIAAIPSNGFQQIWLYRQDWLEAENLDIPDNYDGILQMAEVIFDAENVISGIVIPTESNLFTTQLGFEHLALANGCDLIDEAGQVRLLDAACREALDFYFSLINQFSPPGVQTDTSARNAFLDGRTGIIMTSPDILPDLVRRNRLDRNTGILTTLTGRGPESRPANLGNLTYLGITREADPEAALSFAHYWFNEGYERWLALESERKVPMRLGNREEPRRFIDRWGTAPIIDNESLLDAYGPEVVALLRDGLVETDRWGFAQGQGGLMGRLYENLTLSIVLQEMLSGYFTSAKTIYEATNRVIALMPDYPFPIEPTPSAEP